MKKMLMIFLFSLSGFLTAQNVMSFQNVFSKPGDTALISLCISNTDEFISFQFDLVLPDKVTFLDESPLLSNRSTNHVIISNMVTPNHLRIFSYSPNNQAFKGNFGEVVSFKLIIGQIEGKFPLTIVNGIIGDSLSQNILTIAEDGTLSIFPQSIHENISLSNYLTCKAISPNPVSTTATMILEIRQPASLSIEFYDMRGSLIVESSLGSFERDKHIIVIPQNIIDKLHSNSIYLYRLVVLDKRKEFVTGFSKIIKN